MGTANLATVAPTPSDPILYKHVVCYPYFCSHSREVDLGIPLAYEYEYSKLCY